MSIISKKIEEELRTCLQELGFTNYEIGVIYAVYGQGPLKADQIAEIADIPLSRVYDAVESLTRKGFLKVSNSRPRVYSAVSPSEASNSYVEKMRIHFENELENIKNLTRQFVEIVQPLFLRRYTEIDPENLITQLNSLEDAELQTLAIMDQAEKEICIFTHAFNWFDKVRDSLFNALKRGIKVRVLLQSREGGLSSQIKDELESHGGRCKVYLDDSIKTRGTIVDGQTVIFVMWATETGSFHPRKIFKPQFSTNPGIVKVFQNNFDYLWNLQS
ncbi:MAG: hypothetical protein D6732_15550 [Methanobacteriota archaeon]|nr:MAG: hypothetical protein D6732_15550 [Euryarchaeota archaeon]